MKPIIKKYALLLITASIFTSVASVAKGQSYNNQQAAPVYYDYRKVNFQDGSSYEGGMVNDEKQGFGVYYYSDGKKYTVTLEKHPNYVIIGTNNRQKTAKHSELS